MADALADIGYTRAAVSSKLADEQVVIGKFLGGCGDIVVKEEDSR